MKRKKPMKRTEMKRGDSELKRVPTKRNRKRMSQRSSARDQRDKGYAAARVVAFELAHGRCRVRATSDCTGQCEQIHHIAGRTGEDPHRQSNLLACCAPCHAFVHSQPKISYEKGWMVGRGVVTKEASRD